MDTVDRYHQVLVNVLDEQPEVIYSSSDEDAEVHKLVDQAHKRYMIYRVGWRNKERIASVLLYLHIKNGRIWIEEDWTEEGIAPALLAAGVPKEDIVLGFRHPAMRPLTEFAAA